MSRGRDFHKYAPEVWRSRRFLGVPLEARYLWHYLAFNDHQTSAGCYLLPPAYACADLGIEPAQFYDWLRHLIEADLAMYDYDTSEVLICRWFQHNAPTNAKHAAGVYSYITKLESQELQERAEEEFGDTRWGEAFLNNPNCTVRERIDE